jgi:purine nucleosidase/pyrimidine-specific ribonucleoside hydrolase
VLALIDTDPGIDDALALLYAWGSPELTLAGITTVAGNVTLADATRNVFRLLALRGVRPWPPVAEGAAAPLGRPLVTATGYHGADGLGALTDWPPVQPVLASEPAAAFIAAAAWSAREPLTLVALGPLTNVALALEHDAGALRRLARVVVMGGAVDVPGNVTPDAEFNIHVDPAAAARVLAAGLPVDLIPLDATRQAVLTRQAFDTALARRPGPLATRVAAFTRHGFRGDDAAGAARMFLHDPLAVAAALDPTLVGWEPVRLAIGPDGQTRRQAGAANCRVARTVDGRRFMRLFLERLWPAS